MLCSFVYFFAFSCAATGTLHKRTNAAHLPIIKQPLRPVDRQPFTPTTGKKWLSKTKTTAIRGTKTLDCPNKPLWACPCEPKDGLVLIESRVPFHQAECACKLLGLHLANVDTFNYLHISSLGNECLQENSHAWIRSWNNDTYTSDTVKGCLAYFTGSTDGAGAVAVPAACGEYKPVVCQVPEGKSCGVCRDDEASLGEWCGCSTSDLRDGRNQKPAPTRCYDRDHPARLRNALVLK